MIIRAERPETGFTLIRNDVLRDARLSFRARGILASILSRPDNWVTSADRLAKEAKEGRGAILAAMKELQDHGYLLRTKVQDPETGQWASAVVVYDTPQAQTEPQVRRAKPKPLTGVTQATYANRETALAAGLVDECWNPLAAGRIAQPPVAVVKIVEGALLAGFDEAALRKALSAIATRGTTLTRDRLSQEVAGKQAFRGALVADAKVDWSSHLSTVRADGEAPF